MIQKLLLLIALSPLFCNAQNNRNEYQGDVNYKEGKEHAMMELYHQNGKLMLGGFFKEAIQIGVWKYYDENGALINTENFEN